MATQPNLPATRPPRGGLPLWTALAALLIVALVAIFRRHARDDVYVGLTPGLTPGRGDNARVGKKSGKQNLAVAFQPPKGAHPGEVGTLIDATADNVDISATLVDLAVRGHMRISDAGNNDHLLTRTRREADPIEKYEAKLLDRLFKSSDEIRISELADAKYACPKDVRDCYPRSTDQQGDRMIRIITRFCGSR